MFLIHTHCSWSRFWFIIFIPGHVPDSYSLFLVMFLIHIHCSWSCFWFIFTAPGHVPDSYALFLVTFLIHNICSWSCFWFIIFVPDHVSDSYSLFLVTFLIHNLYSWSCSWFIFIVLGHVSDSYALFLVTFLIHNICSWSCFWFNEVISTAYNDRIPQRRYHICCHPTSLILPCHPTSLILPRPTPFEAYISQHRAFRLPFLSLIQTSHGSFHPPSLPGGMRLPGAWLGKAYILFRFCLFYQDYTCIFRISVILEIQERDDVCVSLAIALGRFS